MTKPKVEPCILSLSVRSPSECLTWWLLTALQATVSGALFSISHCVTWCKLVRKWEEGSQQWEAPLCSLSFCDCEVQTIVWSLSVSLSHSLSACFHLLSSSFYTVVISAPSFFLWASPTIKTEREDKSVLFFCCLQKYKTEKTQFVLLSFPLSLFLFIPYSSFKAHISYPLVISPLSTAESQQFLYLPGVLNKSDYVEAGLSSVFMQFWINGASAQRSRL